MVFQFKAVVNRKASRLIALRRGDLQQMILHRLKHLPNKPCFRDLNDSTESIERFLTGV